MTLARLFCVALMTINVVSQPVCSGNAATPAFLDGKSLLPVFIAADAAPEERAAAEELGRVLGRMSGLDWSVCVPTTAGERGFYIGRGVQASVTRKLKVAENIFLPRPGEIGPDGFRIESHDGSVFIEGATPEATGFAVAWLLQHEGGVRWYLPGSAGEIIPRKSQWSLPDMHVVREPAYVSREITGLQTPDEKKWAWHNGLSSHLEFNHALGALFPPSLANDHPDWFPLLEGARYRPSPTTEFNWQPNLALSAVAEHAARAAVEALSTESKWPSFSLGMNDSIRFDQSAATRTLVEPLRYFRGMPDYSPLVFSFMNRAAEILSHTHPDRYLGCLAYFWCENPPPFAVHRSVLPFVTTDRSHYYDREYRAADLSLMSRWGASGVNAYGLWEYAYGRGFVIPRMPLNALAESVREGWHRGARGYLAEVEPRWGFDAFKVWMLAQLLWEPDRPLGELADDFYHGCYGPATGPMRHFFSRCEEQWTRQGGAPFWLKYYQQEDQILLFPADVCHELQALLQEAMMSARDDAGVSNRVAETVRAFAVTEAYEKFDSIRRRIAAVNLQPSRAEEAVWAAMIRDLIQAESNFQKAARISMAAVDLGDFIRNDPVPRLLWLAGKADHSAPIRILNSAGVDAIERRSWHALAELLAMKRLAGAPNLIVNSSFIKTETEPLEPRFLYPGFGSRPAKWRLKATPTENGKVGMVTTGASGDPHAVRIEGAWDTQLYQWIPVEPGCTYVATANFRGKSSPGNDAGLFLTFLNSSGVVMGTPIMQSMPKASSSDWRTAVLVGRSVAGAAWVGIGVGSSRQSPNDWLEAARVELRGVIQGKVQ
jgi:Domain of unknown function (DUF4838)